ncbi:MAG: hypothetical protein BWK75_01975 [Candidatus Altiarchaeales archaeon A3]|nr:MAG: hypothetical protein BWK75_01975 [Candidatus Altiarchaeales archaeon A3]
MEKDKEKRKIFKSEQQQQIETNIFNADTKKLKKRIGKLDYYEFCIIYDFRKILEIGRKSDMHVENIPAEKEDLEEYAEEFKNAIMFCIKKGLKMSYEIFAGTKEVMIIFTTTEQYVTNKYTEINDNDLDTKKKHLPEEITNSFINNVMGIDGNILYILRENKIIKWKRTRALEDARWVFGKLYENLPENK